jgi:hypothetical protein
MTASLAPGVVNQKELRRAAKAIRAVLKALQAFDDTPKGVASRAF